MKDKIKVIVFVEGGVVSGARASVPECQIDFQVMDNDNWEECDQGKASDYEGPTPEEYDALPFPIY